MEDKDAHSVIVNIPRSRVLFIRKSLCNIQKTNLKKRICKKPIRKPSESSLRKYSLHDDTNIHAEDFKKDHLLLPYRSYTKYQTSIKNKKRMRIKIQEKYKIINTDLRNRLHVDHPPDDVRAVTSIDDTFFRYFDSHRLPQHIPMYKSLKFILHLQLRMRQEVGYRNDCILNIEVNHRREEQAYERSVQKYVEQLKLLDLFISEDYLKSMACLKKADALASIVNDKKIELQNLASKQFTIQSRLIGIDYLYFMQQKYGRFLYYLSPPSWRSKNRDFAHSVEIEAKGFDLGVSSEEDAFTVIFEKMQSECYTGLVKPVLYFTHPSDLLRIFDSLAKQNLHHFSYITHLAPHAKIFKKCINRLKSDIENETTLVVRQINNLEKVLKFLEDKKEQLRSKFMKVLYELFYNSVAATDVLKLQLHLQFCYEKLYREKAENTNLLSNAKAVESMYMEYSYKLDVIHGEKIKLYMKKCNEREHAKLKKAKTASQELRLFDNLERSLRRAHEPVGREKQPITKKSNTSSMSKRKHVPKRVKKKSEHRDLTEAEVEYLTLFTEWTENDNPAKYLQSLTDDNHSG